MPENNDGPETPGELGDLQKAALERIKYWLKEEKKPQRTLTILHLRFNIGLSQEKVGHRIGLDRESVRRIEKEFITKIAQDLDIIPKEVKKILTGMLLGTAEEMMPPPITLPKVTSTDELFVILCQHIVERPSGLRIVKEPVGTLNAREDITPEEAEKVLKEMCARGLIEGIAPWTVIKIIPEVAIPEFKSYGTRGMK